MIGGPCIYGYRDKKNHLRYLLLQNDQTLLCFLIYIPLSPPLRRLSHFLSFCSASEEKTRQKKMSRILLGRAGTVARNAGSRIARVFKNPNTQDSLVISSSELGAAVGKKVLDGGSKKTPPSPSPSPYLIPNPDAMVEQVGHHPRPVFTCCFPIVSRTPPTPLHTRNYSDLQPMFPEEISRGEGGDFLTWKRNGGASMIVLHHEGLAQPFFSDHSKVAVVLEGTFSF